MRIPQRIALLPLLAGFAALAQASVVHKWVDGVTHYSDEPPPANATGFERIDLPTPPAPVANNSREDYYTIANQWRRMHRERIEIERVRAERPRDSVGRRRADSSITMAPESRRSVVVLPRLRPRKPRPRPAPAPAYSAAETRGRANPPHPLAIPGRDWPVGLHPARHDLRGGFSTQ